MPVAASSIGVNDSVADMSTKLNSSGVSTSSTTLPSYHQRGYKLTLPHDEDSKYPTGDLRGPELPGTRFEGWVHGLRRDAELFRDLTVGLAAEEEVEDLLLALRQGSSHAAEGTPVAAT